MKNAETPSQKTDERSTHQQELVFHAKRGSRNIFTKNERGVTDAICFMFNSFAMGDIIASVPVVKYMIDRYFPTHEHYCVVIKPEYRILLPFVPDKNILDYNKKENMWGIPETYAISALNQKKDGRITRVTPKHMHLSTYASIQLADRVLPYEDMQYVPLQEVDVSHFGVDFTKAVVLVTSYRDVTRMWHAEHVLGVASWLKENGFIPVFIGKTDMDQHIQENLRPKTSLPDDVSEYGVDLRNKTSLLELASIMKHSRAVCGVDSGPIHLAGTTHTPIICGYTSVSSENRIPLRKGITIPIEPAISCIGCESAWHSSYWNFENCFYKHSDCCAQMTSDKFIDELKKLL